MNTITRLHIIVCSLCLASTALPAVELKVSPNGPLTSLAAARDAVRELKAKGPITEPVRILVANGEYPVTEPLVLSPADSGTAQAPISYEAAPGARPLFNGGRPILEWQPGADGIWQARIPEVAAGKWYFEQLFVNGRRATRARTPNKFWFYMVNAAEEVIEEGAPTDQPPHNERPRRARQTVWIRPADFTEMAGLAPEEQKDVNLVIYAGWDNARRLVDRIDETEKTIQTTGRGMKPWNNWTRNTPFIIENLRSALDEPGEWFLSRNGTLFYKPLPGEDMTKAEVFAPVTDKFMILAGEPAEGKYVEHVAFKGLAFRHAQGTKPPTVFEPIQAAASVDAVVQADGARHVTFEDCEIGHVGTYGIWFRKGCRDNAVRRCFLHDLGAGGIRIGEAAMPKTEPEQTSHNIADNNIILHGGYIYPSAVGIWIGFSPDNQITHNEIADLFYSGISVGWVWGYSASNCKRNNISFNHIHHLGKGLLSDMGGIYTLGLSEGTVIANNVIHDIYTYSYGGWGMYNDQGSAGIVWENNLVYNTKSGAYHPNAAKENILRNNIFAFATLNQIDARAEPRKETNNSNFPVAFTIEKNIVYWTSTHPVLPDDGKRNSDPKLAIFRNNCYWNAAGHPVTFGGTTLEQWQAMNYEAGSIVADPLFVDAAKFDFRLKPGSPALALGFKPFDPTQAGVYGDADWVAKARNVTYPPLDTETPRKTPVNNPGLNLNVSYAEGTVVNSFALLSGKGMDMDFEWRDGESSPPKTGAQFSIRGGKLRVGDSITLDLPTSHGGRTQFEVTGGVGKTNTGKWSLTVTVLGQPPQTFKDLPYASPDFNKLTCVGFTGDAKNPPATSLINISMSVRYPCLNFLMDALAPLAGTPSLIATKVSCLDGTVENKFDLLNDTGVNFDFEWRDGESSPPKIGARFSIRGGKLLVGDSVTDLPTGRIQFGLSGGVGKASTGKWLLEVIVPGQPPQKFRNLPYASPEFNKLTWFGFTGDAKNPPANSLRNISLSVR
jgi:hypothetical protein